MSLLRKSIIFFILIFSNFAFSEELNIAVILATGDHHTSTAKEKVCVITGLLEHAKKEGLPIKWAFYDNDRTVVKTGEAAAKIVKNGADVVITPLVSREGLAAVEILKRANIPIIVTGTTPKLTQNRVYTVVKWSNTIRHLIKRQ